MARKSPSSRGPARPHQPAADGRRAARRAPLNSGDAVGVRSGGLRAAQMASPEIGRKCRYWGRTAQGARYFLWGVGGHVWKYGNMGFAEILSMR